MIKQTSKGQTVEITVIDSRTLEVSFEGKIMGRASSIDKLHQPVQGHTHKVSVAGNAYCLTPAEVEILQGEIDAATQVYTASDRNILVAAVTAAAERRQEIMEQTVRTSKLDETADKEATQRYNDAVSALDEFDAAHPEIVEGIKAERQAAVARNIWN